MNTLGCMFSTNIFSLGLFLPVSAGIIILINLVFGFVLFKKLKEERKAKKQASLLKKED